MKLKELEQRVAALERQVKELAVQIAMTRNRNWLNAIEKYTGDQDLLSIFADAMKLREKERRAVRRKWAKSRNKSC